jgi:hypothetical protein
VGVFERERAVALVVFLIEGSARDEDADQFVVFVAPSRAVDR